MAVTNQPEPPPRPDEQRLEQMRQLAAWHHQWAATKLAGDGDIPFEPEGRKKGSDYNQHNVDLEVDDDAFHKRARQILGIK